ncbi:MAG: phosphatase PAP2 family protein [Dehalococcoidia bacterium]
MQMLARRPSLPPPSAPSPGRGRWRLASREVGITAAIMVVYFLLRGIRPEATDQSVARSLALIRFEQRADLFWEVRLQQLFIGWGFLMHVANLVYAWGHYPVMLAIAVWLAIKDPVRFRFIRNVLFVSAFAGLVTYWLLPAAPPRLMELHGYDFGFIDTVHGAASNVHYFQPGPFVNDYAAIPSFHFGWIALSSAAIWINSRSRIVRAGAVAMSVVMWWAITVTGNHYFFDMIFGGLIVAFSWLIVASLPNGSFVDALRRVRRRPAAA